MRRLRSLTPTAVAVFAAVFLSIFVPEDSIVVLSCMAAMLIGLVVAGIRCLCARQSRWRVLGLTILPTVVFAVIAWSHLPLRIVFHAYRSQFDQVASRIVAGNPPATPFRVGPFRIKLTGRRGDSETPYLAVNEDPWEIDGFVRHPDGHGFNLWSCITLDDTWSYIAED